MSVENAVSKIRIFWTLLFVLLLFFSVMARMYQVHTPLVDFPGGRQAEGAWAARAFYEKGFKLLLPETGLTGESKAKIWRGELQLHPLVVAALYRISGGIDERWGRIVSISFGLGSLIIFYYSAVIVLGEVGAFFSLFILCFSPLNIYYHRTFQPEAMMQFFVILSLFSYLKYSKVNRKVWLIAGNLSMAVAMLLKLTAICLLPVVAVMLWRKAKGKELKLKDIVLSFIIIFSFPFLLYGIWHYYLSHFRPRDIAIMPVFERVRWENMYNYWVNKNFWREILHRFVKIFPYTKMSAFGFIGVVLMPFKRDMRPFFFWILAFYACYLIGAEAFGGHEYYMMPVMPAIALGACTPFTWLRKLEQSFLYRVIAVVCAIYAICYSASHKSYMECYGRFFVEYEDRIEQAVNFVKQNLPEGCGLITNEPSLLYYSRCPGFSGFPKGWGISDYEKWERDSSAAGRYVVIWGLALYDTDETGRKEIINMFKLLVDNFKLVACYPDVMIFDLNSRVRNSIENLKPCYPNHKCSCTTTQNIVLDGISIDALSVKPFFKGRYPSYGYYVFKSIIHYLKLSEGSHTKLNLNMYIDFEKPLKDQEVLPSLFHWFQPYRPFKFRKPYIDGRSKIHCEPSPLSIFTNSIASLVGSEGFGEFYCYIPPFYLSYNPRLNLEVNGEKALTVSAKLFLD